MDFQTISWLNLRMMDSELIALLHLLGYDHPSTPLVEVVTSFTQTIALKANATKEKESFFSPSHHQTNMFQDYRLTHY